MSENKRHRFDNFLDLDHLVLQFNYIFFSHYVAHCKCVLIVTYLIANLRAKFHYINDVIPTIIQQIYI